MKFKMLCSALFLCVVLLAGQSAEADLVAMFDGTSANLTPMGKIMTWYDQSGIGGNNDAQGLEPDPGDPDTRPLLVDMVMPNGQTMKVADFDGTNDNLTIGGNSAFDGMNRTWVVVAKADSLDSSLLFSGAYSSGSSSIGNRYMWDTWADGDSYRARGRDAAGTSLSAESGYGNVGEWAIVIGTWQSNNNVRVRAYALEDESLTLHYHARGPTDANPTGHLRSRIGADSEATPGSLAELFFDGQIAEVRYYDTNFGSDDATALAEELQAKYVPEPASVLLLAAGVAGLMRRRRAA
jgi:hypothetical protein